MIKKNRKQKANSNQEKAKLINEKFTHAVTWRQPYKDRWDRFYKMYRSELDEVSYPWQSNLFIPYSFSTVETLVPRLASNRPQIDIMPQEPQDQKRADLMGKLIDFQWDKMNMNVIMPEAIREMLIYGTVIMKVYWHQEDEKTMVDEEVDETMPELGTVQIEREVTTYVAPKIELVDLYDFFIDPKASSIDEAEWVIHRSIRSISYLKDMKKNGKYKNINLIEGGGGYVQDHDEKAQRRSTVGVSIPEQGGEQMVEILEYWTDEKITTIANRSIIIREEKNPFRHGKKPFVYCVDTKIPHEFYGMGLLEPIESLQYELNDRRNQRMDNITQILNKQWIVDEAAGVDEDELISEPGGVIHTKDMNGIEAVKQSDVTGSSYQEETLIKGDIQQTTGVSDFTKGVGSDSLGNDTATGISLIQEAGNSRFKLKMNNIEDMMIKKLGEFMVSLNNQFIEDDLVVRILGDEGMAWKEVKPEDLRGNYDVVVKSGAAMPGNEAVHRKQVMDLFKVFAGDPEVNQRELKKQVMKAVMPDINLEEMFPDQQQGMMPGMEQAMPDTGQQLNQENVLMSANSVPQPGI